MGNTHEIQNGRNKIRDWFLPIATKVKPDIASGSTAQGKYVVAADGTAYGFNNNRSVDRVLQLMDRSLESYKKSPPSKVTLDDSMESVSFAPLPPDGAAVLRFFTRIRPAPLGCDSSNENVARDHFWILKDELELLMSGKLAESLKLRFLRFALVDNVRGEPDYWSLNDIRSESLKVAQAAKGKWKLAGSFRLATDSNSRGYEGRLEGEFSFDPTGALRDAKVYSEGNAWGASTYAPNPPPGRFPLLIGFSLEKDREIAPQAALFGGEYLRGR